MYKGKVNNMSSFIDPETIEIGTILYSSWGYEQTNITFYQLVRKSGKAVYLCKIESEFVRTQDFSGMVMPKPGHFQGNEVRKILRKPKDGIMHDCQYIQLWDGTAKRFSSYH